MLPAHISMGMKLTIIERLKGCGDRRYIPDNNFHSLYVKRHRNVRWAAAAPECQGGAARPVRVLGPRRPPCPASCARPRTRLGAGRSGAD